MNDDMIMIDGRPYIDTTCARFKALIDAGEAMEQVMLRFKHRVINGQDLFEDADRDIGLMLAIQKAANSLTTMRAVIMPVQGGVQ